MEGAAQLAVLPRQPAKGISFVMELIIVALR